MLLGKQFNSVRTPDTITSTPGHLLQEAKVNQQTTHMKFLITMNHNFYTWGIQSILKL